MTDICERCVVHRIESDASHALAAFVAKHRAGDGSVRIALRLPVTMFAAWKSAIERRGVADFFRYSQAAIPFPPTLSAGRRATADHSRSSPMRSPSSSCDRVGLVLSGNYVPPFGRFGALFDAVIGHRIAHATARDLLSVIASYIEALPLQLTLPATVRPAGAGPAAITL